MAWGDMPKKGRKLSIRARTVLLSVAVTALTTVGFTVAYVAIARASALSSLRELADRSIARLRDGIEYPLWNLDWPSCGVLLRGELNDVNLVAAACHDETGAFVAAFGRLGPTSRADPGGDVVALDEAGLRELARAADFPVQASVIHQGQVVGTVDIYTSSAASLGSLASSAAIAALLALFVGAGISMSLFFFMDRAVTSRLLRLDGVVERFAARELDSRSADAGSDVIGHLAASFNTMADDIESYNRGLQSMVEERTSRLIEAEKLAFMGGLAAGVAHEVNTPVGVAITASSHARAVVEGLLDSYRKGTIDEEGFIQGMGEALEAFDLIGNNLARAAEFVRTFKKLAADQAVEERRPVRVAEYLHETLVSLRPRLKHSRIAVEVDCDEGLEVETVPSALYQIVTNLVTNSLMHAFEEGQEGRVRIGAALAGRELVIDYRDDGKGIAPEHQASLFEPFFTTRRGSGGTGLGLHIIRNIATKMGGGVACESSPGKGVHFTVKLPVEPAGGKERR